MVNIAVVGCGQWGPNLIRNFQNLPEADLLAICDRDTERLAHMQPLYPGVKCTTDYTDLLQKPDLDAISIATPLATHYALVKQALEAGKHVLVEKPLASTVAQCEELVALAEKRRCHLMVGHVFLFNRAVHYVKTLLSEGALGDLHYCYFTRTNLGPVREDASAMWDLATHDISIVMDWMDSTPKTVKASGYTYLDHDVEDVVFAELEFDSGVVAHLHVSWLDPCKVRRATLIGTKKMVVYADTEPIAPITMYDKHIDPPPFTDTMAAFQMSIRDGDILIPRLSIGEPLKAECQHFLESVANDTRPRSDGRCGLDVVRVLERLQESIALDGRPLPLDTK